MDKGLSKILASAVQTEAVVTCAFCGEKHRVSEETFFVFYGDMSEGIDGKLITGNIDNKGKVIGSTVLCKRHHQVMEFAQMFIDEQAKGSPPNNIKEGGEPSHPTKRR